LRKKQCPFGRPPSAPVGRTACGRDLEPLPLWWRIGGHSSGSVGDGVAVLAGGFEHVLVGLVCQANFDTVAFSGSAVSSASALISRVLHGLDGSMMKREQLGFRLRFLYFWRSSVIDPLRSQSSSTRYQTAVDCGRPLESTVVSAAVSGELNRSR
jgi:hypothetical protein